MIECRSRLMLLWIIVLAALSAGALLAQNITGTWQGTLQAGRELRTVIKISKADNGTLKAVLYSIDQGGRGIPASAVTLNGSSIKISIVGIGGTYAGRLNADGNSITGTWTQGDQPLPLNLKRATSETEWTIPPPPPRLKPMPANASPVFEVATIKPSKPGGPGKGFMVRGRQFSTLNTSLSDLITFAYGLHSRHCGRTGLDENGEVRSACEARRGGSTQR
jgi:hypothetical protein